MYEVNYNSPVHIHFIGIGGISMSGLAKILHDKGFTISGSDSAASDLTRELEAMGCRISYPQAAANITPDIDVIVYTAAIHPDNPEFVAAKASGKPMMSRADLLGQIMLNYDNVINVAGTHGKTTTTSMIAEILIAADADPTITVGGILNTIGGNTRIGKSDIFVAEACEYTNSFLSFNPTINIILNVKADHLDFFKDLDDIRHSFKLFTELLPDSGTLIVNSDIANYDYFYSDKKCEVIAFGSDPRRSNYSATDITYNEHGCATYTLVCDGKKIDTIELSVPGQHNVYNSIAAIIATSKLSVSMEDIKKGLKHYTGTNRRFEHKGEFNGVTVIDDYAHHPDEIRATLATAARCPHNNVWCVFQPHTYTRTKSLMDGFAEALTHADKVVLAKIYPARETDNLGISSQTLCDEITALGKECYYYETFEEIEEFLQKNCINGDMLITMGAGDVYKIGEYLVK